MYTLHFVVMGLSHFKEEVITKKEELKLITKKLNYFGIAGVNFFFYKYKRY